MYNEISLDTVCASLAKIMGITPPGEAKTQNDALIDYADSVFEGEKADRIFMFNPDAIAQWVYEKYPNIFDSLRGRTEKEIPLLSVMPSVTPVCFGTMYTGAQPSVHGIRKYEKPVISIDTLFDALIRAGRKPVILAYGTSSLSKIYLERDMDYYIFETMDEANAKAMELIIEDKHDFYVVYNGNYDSKMHKFGPESPEAIGELCANVRTYNIFYDLISARWKNHNTLVGFAMDHGCHEIDENSGAHGLDMKEDLNIVHLYKAIKRK